MAPNLQLTCESHEKELHPESSTYAMIGDVTTQAGGP